VAFCEQSRQVRWSWVALVLTSIVCACGGGHDAKTKEAVGSSASAEFGVPGSCPAIVVTATGAGIADEGNWSGNGQNFALPSTFTVSSGTTTGYTVYLYLAAGADLNALECTYTASDPITFTFASCNNPEDSQLSGTTPNSQEEGVQFVQLEIEGSGGPISVTASLGSVPVSDSNPCTTDTCAQTGGVSHTTVPNGTPCSGGGPGSGGNPGGVCEGTQTCQGGSCVAGTPPPTTSPNPCLTYAGCYQFTGPYYTSTGTCSTPTGAGVGFDPTVPTNLVSSASFLWAGSPICAPPPATNPATCINLNQVAVVRGRVLANPPLSNLTGSLSPVSGAAVTILNHPESSATTRPDGWFDIPVNGGAQVTVQIQANGYPVVQRHILTRWQQYAVLSDIYLTPPDIATSIALNSASYQAAAGTPITNANDTQSPATTTRTARVLFPPNTQASFTYGPCSDSGTCTASGTTCSTATNLCTGPQQTGNLTVSATEYTVGMNGPSSMPADLPPSSAYTYAVELSAVEAAGAGIAFTTNVVFYVENFLGFPSGTNAPVGYYDRFAGRWVAMADGLVFNVTTIQTGASNCSGYTSCANVDNAGLTLGLSAGELYELSQMYPSGNVSVWRVTTTHFSGVDINYAAAPPGLGGPLPPSPPGPPTPGTAAPVDNPCLGSGSIIECENQILAQELPIAGTPFSLRYQSDRAPGRTPTINIPITGPTVPSGLGGVKIIISIAGLPYTYDYDNIAPNQSFTWTWDRLDAYGNTVQGLQTADVYVIYAYPGIYSPPPPPGGGGGSFGEMPSGVAPPISSQRLTLTYNYTFESFVQIGVEDAQPLGLGGWTLSANHLYEPSAHVLWEGNGKRRTVEAATSVIQTVAGSACNPANGGDGGPAVSATFSGFAVGANGSLAAGPDGSYYVTDYLSVRRVDPSGTIHHFAGNGTNGGPCTGPGPCPAASSWVNPLGLAVGPDSSVYIGSPALIQKVDPQGNITTIAGVVNGVVQDAGCADGPLGTGTLRDPVGLAVAPDGSVLVADEDCGLRRIGADGTLRTLSGPSASCSHSETGLVGSICLAPTAVAAAPDGTIYVANGASVIRVDAQTGVVRTYAGFPPSQVESGPPSSTLDGIPATAVTLGEISELSVAADGTLYMSDYGSSAIWSVDPTGIAHVIAGGTTPVDPPNTTGNDNGGPAPVGYVPGPVGVAVGPNGSVYAADYSFCRVRAISPSLPGYTSGVSGSIVTSIPAEDGSEVYGFDSSGRHIATFDPTTGATLLSFTYSPGTNLLKSIVDANGNTTTIAPSITPSGTATITPPFSSSQQTKLTLDSTGHATAITDPQGETTQCTYSSGLMQTFTTAAGYVHTFGYDGQGNLLSDEGPPQANATQYLSRSVPSTPPGTYYAPGINWSTAIISGAGYTTLHNVTETAAGLLTQTVKFPSGATGSYSRSALDALTQTLPDGTVTATTMASDPQFGMLAPYPATVTVTTPVNNLIMTTSRRRTATPGGSPPSLATPATINETTTVNPLAPVPEVSTRVWQLATPPPGGTWTYTSAAGRVRQETIDGQGRVVGVSFPGSQLASTALVYDARGRLSSVVSTPSAGAIRTWGMKYDSPGLAGYLYSTTDPAGNTTIYATRDGVGRPTNVLLPDYTSNPSSQYSASYDSDGNMATLTVPPATSSSSVHTFTPNNLDLLGIYSPPPDGLTPSQTSYAYNADWKLQSISPPVGSESIAYNYDMYGRLSAIRDGSTNVPRQFTYYTNNNNAQTDQIGTATIFGVQAPTNLSGDTLTYTYDGFLKTSATLSGSVSGSVAWTYDNFFRVTQRTVNGGTTVAYNYDNDNLFTGTSSPAAFSVTRDYTNYYGRVTGTTLGVVSDTVPFGGYNGFGELLGYIATNTAASPPATLYQLQVTSRDPNGRILAMTELINGASHAWTLVYDTRGRLKSATRGSTTTDTTNTYTYDPNGNRLTMNGSAAWTYDSQDRLTSAPGLGISYTYRNDGTALTKTNSVGEYSYVYDLSGALQSVVLPGTSPGPFGRPVHHTVSYTMDGLNRRTGKRLIWFGTSQVGQQFVYDDQLRVAAELNGSAVTSVFVYGTKPNVPDYMISVKNGGAVYRIISDWAGSVRLVVNAATGAIVQQLDYDEFGNVVQSTSFDTTCAPTALCLPFQPFGFAGGLWDRDTGLVRFGARDYDPQVGRWISKDPIRFGGGLNLYGYCHSDPIDCIDASGLDPLSSFTQGFVDGAFAALVVGGGVVALATLGVPAAVLGGVLAVGTAVGAGALGVQFGDGLTTGNWDPFAYSAGSLVGGAIVGGATGTVVSDGLNGAPSPPWSLGSDWAQRYDPNWVDPVTGTPGSIGKWWGSGLNPGSAAALTAGSAAAVGATCQQQ
jgi:RHS repeat-associated protein